MAEEERRKEKRKGNFFTNINNNGETGQSLQNAYNPEIRDWEHRIKRLRDL